MSTDSSDTGAGLLRVGRSVDIDGHRYTVTRYLDSGSTGELYLVKESGQLWVLKLYVPGWNVLRDQQPITQARWDNLSEAIKYQSREHEFLTKLNHPNIVRVRARGDLPLQQKEKNALKAIVPHADKLPVIVTEYIEGMTLDQVIASGSLKPEQITRVLGEVADALDYVHQDRQYLHGDVRARNIIVRDSDKSAVLIDFATSKNFNFDEVRREDKTMVAIPGAVPIPPLASFFESTSGEALMTRQELFEACFPTLDLWQFGTMLKTLRPGLVEALHDEKEIAYLDHLSEQLATWDTAASWDGGLGPKIGRLGAHHFYPFGIAELGSPSTAPRNIVLPTGDTVPLVGLPERMVANRSFRRLATINQLSLLPFVYPGADYKRFVHALHTFELARRLVGQLLGTPTFRQIFDETSVRQLLMVALAHDINHFPFLHIVQEARIDGLNNRAVTDIFCNGEATGENQHGESSVYQLLEEAGISRDRFVALAYGDHEEQATPVDQVINSMISSGADIDKMSYLSLDSLFTGVSFGQAVDTGTLFRAATLGSTEDGRFHLAFEESGLQAVENVFMTRFWNFRSIYWHHTNRALMAMVLHAVRRLFEERGRNINEYLTATKWEGDYGALRWLDQQYRSMFGQSSVLAELVESRRGIYRRLYTVRPTGGKATDDQLFRQVSALASADQGSYEQELALRTAVASRLAERYGVSAGEHDVLIDVPRRGSLNDPGDAYLVSRNSAARRLSTVSEPIRMLQENYKQLTQRVRFFVAPHIADVITKEGRETDRPAIGRLILDAVAEVKPKRGGIS
jgi:uncharacterized protein